MPENQTPIAFALLHPDGPTEDAIVMLSEAPTPDELHAAIDPLIGGRFEQVIIHGPYGPRDMFMHAAGARDGLPFNSAATRMYRAALMTANPTTDPETLPAVHGTAAICHEPLTPLTTGRADSRPN